jgi:branched-chain amino acid transport system substrate-binding protein
VLVDSQDSQGKPADGIEAAPTFLWQPPGADDLQGQVLAQVIGEALGQKAKINVGARNDAYGAGLADQFRKAWVARGGEVPRAVVYNHQQLTQGAPDGWLLIDFCPTFAKLLAPLQRTGQWHPGRSFGSDTLRNCTASGYQNVPGMRADGANRSSGVSLPAYEKLYRANARPGIDFQAWTAEAFRRRRHRLPGGPRGEVAGVGQVQRPDRCAHRRDEPGDQDDLLRRGPLAGCTSR